jgi:hypothetical protein
MSNRISVAQELRTTIWRTQGARFNAARRLRYRERLSTVSIALFSMVGIVLPLIFIGSPRSNRFAAVSVCLSLFVLVISLLDGANRYQIKAERLHQNAVALGELQGRLRSLLSDCPDGGPSPDEVAKVRKEYESKVRECPENHEPIDDKFFRAQRRHSPEFQRADNKTGWFGALVAWVLYFGSVTWLFLAFWVVVGTLIVWLIRQQ